LRSAVAFDPNGLILSKSSRGTGPRQDSERSYMLGAPTLGSILRTQQKHPWNLFDETPTLNLSTPK